MNEWNNKHIFLGDCDLGYCTAVTTFDKDDNEAYSCRVYQNNPEEEDPITYNYDYYMVEKDTLYFGRHEDE